MSYYIHLLIALCILGGCGQPFAVDYQCKNLSPFDDGSGTLAQPYGICSVTQLNEVRNFPSAHFILKKDIDLQGESFAPIATFSGNFNGNNFAIKNFLFSNTGTDDVGLFRVLYNNVVIKNLKLQDVNITGGSRVGPLAGSSEADNTIYLTQIDNVQVTGAIKGTDNVAGLIGKTSNHITITNSNVDIELETDLGIAGGYIGAGIFDISIENSISNGSIINSTSGGIVAGFIGTASGTILSLENLESTMSITGEGDIAAGIIGEVVTTNASITGIVNSGPISATGDFAGGIVGKYSATSSILFENCQNLGSIQGVSSVGGIIGSNNTITTIDLSSSRGNVTATGNGVAGIVGNSSSNITFTDSFSTGDISGVDSVGGILGIGSFASDFTNVYNQGEITGEVTVAGIVGTAFGVTINDSYNVGNIVGDDYVGGLAGSNFALNVANSYSLGSVTGINIVGGLIGHAGNGVVNTSYATGNVSGTTKIGGFAGQNWNVNITNSFAHGNVSGGGGSQYIGGFVGYMTVANLDKVYAKGAVSGVADVGGLVGAITTGACDPLTTFWDQDASGQATSACGTAKTTVLMQDQSTFDGAAAWNFATMWVMGLSGYPEFQ